MLIVSTNPALMAQTSGYGQNDSCTIYIGTGYHSGDGWSNGYIELRSHGQVFKTIQHQQWTPETYAVNVPANDSIDFKWHQGNAQVSFVIKTASNEILYTCTESPREGVFLTIHPCDAPRNVSNATVSLLGDNIALISWVNPNQTINNNPIQALNSIVIKTGEDVVKHFQDPQPNMPMQFVDSAYYPGKFYTFTVYSETAGSKPLEITGPSCHFKLKMQTNYNSWFNYGKCIEFMADGHLLGEYSLTH